MYCWQILTLLTGLFFLSPFTCYLLFVCWIYKGRNDRKGKKGYFQTQFLFSWFTTILWMFSWTSRKGHASRSKCLKNLRNYFWQIVNLWVCYMYLCSIGMFSWYFYKQEIQHAAKPKALANIFSNWQPREKVCLFSQCMPRELRKSFSFVPESPFFRYGPISFPVRGLWGDCYFCIYSFYCMFILFFMLLFF